MLKRVGTSYYYVNTKVQFAISVKRYSGAEKVLRFLLTAVNFKYN